MAAVHNFGMRHWRQRLLIPALGGLAAGIVLHGGLQLVQAGATNLLEVVVAGDGRLKFRPGLVRALSSLGQFGWFVLFGMLCGAFGAAFLKMGSGTVGGVFTPTLFLGAGLGAGVGAGLHSAGFATELPTHPFALVGMGSVLAATTHSPLLAMVMLFEISLNYSMMPPLMLACAVATLVARQLHPDSIYTAPLKARGLEPSADTLRIGAAHQQKIGDLMREPVSPIRDNLPLPEIAGCFLEHTFTSSRWWTRRTGCSDWWRCRI